jgi:hypothetical protein
LPIQDLPHQDGASDTDDRGRLNASGLGIIYGCAERAFDDILVL